ncbi:MAG TPA: ABC transporter ATP-binding protein [Candidatus Nanoarchaeia archaeon]|nr:ABC transporter ATP-binding protein [Candidatus Nanoarchaeia archaeon]
MRGDTNSPVIELKNVWKTYQMGDTVVNALRGVSLQVRKGEFVAVVGPSGSGKSTMMNVIGCLDVPSQGRILLKGRDIAAMAESELASLRGRTIGFIFQQFNLIPTLTAVDNVALPMLFQDTSADARQVKASSLLAKFGLGNRMDHKPNQLSGGQSQRVAIARALVNDPEVILADEPTGNLDSKTGAEVMDFLSEIHERGKTVVLVTHDLDLVHHAERVIHLKDGMIEKVVRGGKK